MRLLLSGVARSVRNTVSNSIRRQLSGVQASCPPRDGGLARKLQWFTIICSLSGLPARLIRRGSQDPPHAALTASTPNMTDHAMPHTDLLINRARLADGATVNIAVAGGKITTITPAGNAPPPASQAADCFDAGGDLLLPGFVEGHCHLDKTWFGLPWMENETGLGIAERAAYEREVEARIAYPTALRAGRLIEQMVACGSTRIRSHVDIAPAEGLTRLEGVLQARESYRDAAAIQVVAFPQMGVMRHAGMIDLLDTDTTLLMMRGLSILEPRSEKQRQRQETGRFQEVRHLCAMRS
jgi:hypothetical protein